eukprot:12282713-Heterocapsa_arctica.AAC.1
MEMDDITGAALVSEALGLGESACGLDQWRPESVKALAQWFPSLFDSLADILNIVELTGEWPTDLASGYTALVPKDGEIPEPKPTDYRPITVLSIIYRLWARYRFRDTLLWQEAWIDDGAW